MIVRELQLQRFRNFDDVRIELDPRITLIAGRNGSGKTNLLEAIAVALGALVESVGVPSRGLEPGDVRRGSRHDDDQPPLRVVCRARIDGQDRRWERNGTADELRPTALAGGEGDALPLFGYYGGRGLPLAAAASGAPRLEAYRGCFDIGDPEDAVVARLTALLQAGERSTLQAVEAVLTECIGDSDPVVLSLGDGGLAIAIGDEAPVRFGELGGGRRRVASIAADLTLRCCALNPQLGASATGGTHGVVLIDQLEAQLHPRWQRYLLDDFAKLFPHLQLVATTMSPFLLQALHAGRYLDLDGRQPNDVPRMSIEDITEEVLGVHMPQRSKRFQDMRRAALEMMEMMQGAGELDPIQKEALKAELDQKMIPFSNEPAWTAVMTVERIAAGLVDYDATEPGDGAS